MEVIAIILDRYEIYEDGSVIDLHKEELDLDYLDIEEEDDIPDFIYKIVDILLDNI
jgi:hypothetical protein